jgi:insulysin
VQSSTHKPQELIVRFELFLEDFIKQFGSKLPKQRFENIQRIAIQSLEMPPENLLLNGMRLFLLGFEYNGNFELIEKRINALKELTYSEIKSAAEEFFSRQNSRRIAILIEGQMPKEKEFSYESISIQDLQSQGQFIAWK